MATLFDRTDFVGFNLVGHAARHWWFDAFGQMNARDFDRIASVEGWHHLEQASADGNGVIIVHHHIVLVHLAWVLLQRRGFGDAMVTIGKEWSRPLRHDEGNASARVDRQDPSQRKFDFLRQLQGAKQVLSKGGVVRILPDGFRGDAAAMSFPFYNRMREFRPSFADLAMMTGASVIPVSVTMNSAGRFTIVFHPALLPAEGTDEGSGAAELVKAYVNYVEQQWRTPSLRFISISTLRNFLELPPACARVTS